MKVPLELKILFSSPKRGTLWAYIYFLGGAFQLDLFFHFLYMSFCYTYTSARCGWDFSAETMGRASGNESKTGAKGHCVSAALIRRCLSKQGAPKGPK